MATKRRLEIRVETDEVFIVRRRAGGARIWCAQCERPVAMVTVDQAAVATGVTSRTIFRRVESGMLHFSETHDGRLLVCLDSVLGRAP